MAQMSVSSSDSLNYYLIEYWREAGDPRTGHFGVTKNGPWMMLLIVSSYLLFCKKIGPHLMAKRAPFELRSVLMIYNSSMVIINAWFFVQSIRWLKYGRALIDFNFPDPTETSPEIESHINGFYWYYFTKYVDLLDTVFFVLRKKDKQITTLHLYHHSVVPILGWLTFWYRFNTPSITLFALLNSCVHVVMYSYYLLASLGPSIQKYLWWKRYITQMQLVQFGLFAIYGTLVKCFHNGTYPPTAFWLAYSQPPIFFYMFLEFYLQSYRAALKRQKQKQEEKQGKNGYNENNNGIVITEQTQVEKREKEE